VSGVDEFFRTNAADVTGSSRNKNVHGKLNASLAFKSREKSENQFGRRELEK
jgi:hypothetical protein